MTDCSCLSAGALLRSSVSEGGNFFVFPAVSIQRWEPMRYLRSAGWDGGPCMVRPPNPPPRSAPVIADIVNAAR